MNEMDFWFTQFLVQTPKLCFLNDRNTGWAQALREGSGDLWASLMILKFCLELPRKVRFVREAIRGG
jgi:hypothetical protein